ncbi:MAG: DUF624 domain-containing protein [Pisciglobus halotolerans]|nr:DUF624 domain-containing protein [Pisciglobus halotolerans]
MGEKEDLIEKMYEISDVVVKFVIGNILWLIFNLPNLFLVSSYFFAESPFQPFLLRFLVLSAPILLFPSSQALLCLMREIVLDKPFTVRDTFFLFMSYFKENYLTSLYFGIGFTVTISLITSLLQITWMNSILFFTILIMGLIYVLFTRLKFFLMTAHFSMSFSWKVKQAFRLALGKPVYASASFVLPLLLIWISWMIFPPLVLFVSEAAASYLLYFLFQLEYKKLTKNNRV